MIYEVLQLLASASCINPEQFSSPQALTLVLVTTLVKLHHMVVGGRFLLFLLITAVNVTFATEWSYNKGR